MQDWWEPQIRASRTVWLYADRSELIYLNEEERYIWQRPLPDGKGVEEIPIPGESDREAMAELSKIAQAEWLEQQQGESLMPAGDLSASRGGRR